jgi:prepilin-type processing-associated H-X9-DG protein
VSDVWICPARPAPFVDYGITYAFVATNSSIGGYTSIHRGRAKHDNTAVVLDNTAWLPYIPGAMAPPSVGSTYLWKPNYYVHRNKSQNTAVNILYLDGHVELQASN